MWYGDGVVVQGGKPIETGQPFNPYRLFTGIFIPNCLVKHQGISATAKMCWGRLAQYAGKDGAAYPSQETLAKEIGITKRQCVRVLNSLEAQGFLERIVPNGNDKWMHKTTYYLFLWHDVFNVSVTMHSDIDVTSLSDANVTQRDSLKIDDEPKQPIRPFEEFIKDRSSPDSTPFEEDHKRIRELQGEL